MLSLKTSSSLTICNFSVQFVICTVYVTRAESSSASEQPFDVYIPLKLLIVVCNIVFRSLCCLLITKFV